MGTDSMLSRKTELPKTIDSGIISRRLYRIHLFHSVESYTNENDRLKRKMSFFSHRHQTKS